MSTWWGQLSPPSGLSTVQRVATGVRQVSRRTGVEGEGLQAGCEAADGGTAEGLMHEVDALLHLAASAEEDEDVAGHLGAVDVENRLHRHVQVVAGRRLHAQAVLGRHPRF